MIVSSRPCHWQPPLRVGGSYRVLGEWLCLWGMSGKARQVTYEGSSIDKVDSWSKKTLKSDTKRNRNPIRRKTYSTPGCASPGSLVMLSARKFSTKALKRVVLGPAVWKQGASFLKWFKSSFLFPLIFLTFKLHLARLTIHRCDSKIAWKVMLAVINLTHDCWRWYFLLWDVSWSSTYFPTYDISWLFYDS